MKKGFTFNHEAGLIALNHLHDMIPFGVELHSYFINSEKKYFYAEKSERTDQVLEITEEDQVISIKNFRKNLKTSTSWLLKTNLPLINDMKIKSNQFEIFDENEHLALCLRINSMYDDQNDVICIVFKPGANIFGIDTGKISLTTENKNFIANILYKSVTSILKNSFNDKQQLEKFSEKTIELINKGKQYKKSLVQSREDYHRSIINIAENYLKEYSDVYDIDFVFSEEAIDHLKSFNSNPVRLKDIIGNAANFAFNLKTGKSDLISIEGDYLDVRASDIYDNTEKTVDKNLDINKLSREARIERMLDDLENAVKKVLANKDKPVGKNVGAACSPSKSAAAITDYVKKNQVSINKILNKYPTRWHLLRESFRPVQNIIVQRVQPNQKTA